MGETPMLLVTESRGAGPALTLTSIQRPLEQIGLDLLGQLHEPRAESAHSHDQVGVLLGLLHRVLKVAALSAATWSGRSGCNNDISLLTWRSVTTL